MLVKGIDISQLNCALEQVNKQYDNNIIYNNEPSYRGRYIQFTIRVNDSRKQGSRRSATGRRIASACWHVHRDLFKRIYKINVNAIIKTGVAVYKNEANFYDTFERTGYKNVGSQVQPIQFEDACNCEYVDRKEI